jgi:hypothetical protein
MRELKTAERGDALKEKQVFKDLGRCQSKTVAQKFDEISCDFERSFVMKDLPGSHPCRSKKGFFLARYRKICLIFDYVAISCKVFQNVGRCCAKKPPPIHDNPFAQ